MRIGRLFRLPGLIAGKSPINPWPAMALLAMLYSPHSSAAVEPLSGEPWRDSARTFELAAATDAALSANSAEASIAPASRQRLTVERGRVRVGHAGLDLELVEPVTEIAFEVEPSRVDAVIELSVFRGEHRIGSQLFGSGERLPSGVTAAADGWVGLVSDTQFDRVRIRNVHAPDGVADFELGLAWMGSDTQAPAIQGSGTQGLETVGGTGNDLAIACQAPLGIVHNVAFGASLVPGSGLVAAAAAYASNLALKYCLTFIEPPQSKFRRVAPGACEYNFEQPHMVSNYENALGISLGYNSNWGELGSPLVYHHNTEVDVMLLYNTPTPIVSPSLDLGFWAQSGSFEATDQIWAQCRDDGSVRFSQLGGSGPMYECPYATDRKLAVPVGEHVLRWRVNARMSALDLFSPLIPGIPPSAKQEPWKGLLKNVIREAILIANDAVFFSGWRIDNNRDVFQSVTVYDEVPPEIDPQPFDTGRIEAELVGGQVQVTIEADEAGGVSARNYEHILRQMYGVSDACGRDTSFSVSYPEPGLRAFWPVSSLSANESFEITWTARDPGPNLVGEQNESTTTMLVEVVDTQPPVIVPPGDIVEVGTGEVSELGQPLVFDFVDLEPAVTNDATLPLGLGLHLVEWTVTDASGNTDSAIQIVNVKSSNLAPAPVAQTGPDRAEAVSFEPTPIRLQGTDPDGDPLRFFIDEAPENGFFVAPLYPYFVEDFRVEQSISDDDLEALCGPDGEGEPFNLEFPSQPEFLTVTDDGRTYVVDKGYIHCSPFSTNGFARRSRIAVFGNDGGLVNVELGANDLRDVVLDAGREQIYATSLEYITDAGLTVLRVYNLDLEQLVNYRMLDIEDREDGSCPTLSDGGCMLLAGQSAVIDDNDLIYVMDRDGAIVVLDGTLPPDFECGEVECRHSPTYVGTLNEDGPVGSGLDARELELDAQGRLYAGRRDRLFRYTASYVAGDGLAYPGTLEGWLGRCDIDLAPGDQAVCDVANHRSLGFSCTDATCAVDPAFNDHERVTCGGSSVGRERWGRCPGQFSGTPALDLAPDGTVYVADGGNARIQRFSTDGFFAGQAESTCDGSCFVLGDFGNPENVTVNSSRFYILDPDTNLLHISLLTPFVEIGPDYADLEYQSNNDFACNNPADCIDAFSFRVSDGVRDPATGRPIQSAPADVEVGVVRNFRAPFATPGIAVILPEDVPTAATLDGSDPDPLDTLTFAVDQPPEHGTIDISGNQATYTPDTNFFGSDTFTFTASDGNETSAPEAVALTVFEVNDPPEVQVPDPVTVGNGFAYRLDLEFTDPDPDEQHLLTIDWGDGTFEEEGILDSSGNITGPLVSQSGKGTGKINADHVYTSSGTHLVEVCLTDRVTGEDGSEVPTPDSLTACETFPVEVIEGLDLVMLLGFGATERALPNELFEVTFLVLNEPPAAGPPTTATGVGLIVDLPEGLEAGSIVVSGPNCALDELQVTCDVGTLDPGFQGYAQITARVDAATPPGTVLAFTAHASADQVDVNPDNAIAHVINVSQAADLYVDAVADAFLDKPDIDPGDGECASEDGVCTLRAAIEEANAQPGLRTVALGTGVYTLTEGTIQVTDDLLLVGNGAARSVIDGNNSGTAFRVNDEFVTLRIEDLTLSRGTLFASGDLVVRRSRFTGTISGDGVGAAIQASNLIDIRDTTFDDNHSQSGAAVWGNSGSHGVFENVTVVGHTGGGLTLAGTDYTLNHVTITGNVGDSGAASGQAGGAVTLFGNTTATITGSILAGNYPVGNGVIDRPLNCSVGASATLISGGNNVLGDLDGCGLEAAASDILIADNETNLSPLRFAGGRVPFLAPRADSPVIDAMLGPDCPPFDALGVARPIDGDGDGVAHCDMGAVELVPELAPPRLDVAPGQVNFGEIPLGGTSDPVGVSLQNGGEQPLAIGTIGIFGIHAADFDVQPGSDQCTGQTLDPGEQCGFAVVYMPTAAGIRRASARISSNDPQGDREIDLTGTSEVVFADGFESAD